MRRVPPTNDVAPIPKPMKGACCQYTRLCRARCGDLCVCVTARARVCARPERRATKLVLAVWNGQAHRHTGTRACARAYNLAPSSSPPAGGAPGGRRA